MKRKEKNNQKGFTLVEVLAVVVIISIVGGISFITYNSTIYI